MAIGYIEHLGGGFQHGVWRRVEAALSNISKWANFDLGIDGTWVEQPETGEKILELCLVCFEP